MYILQGRDIQGTRPPLHYTTRSSQKRQTTAWAATGRRRRRRRYGTCSSIEASYLASSPSTPAVFMADMHA